MLHACFWDAFHACHMLATCMLQACIVNACYKHVYTTCMLQACTAHACDMHATSMVHACNMHGTCMVHAGHMLAHYCQFTIEFELKTMCTPNNIPTSTVYMLCNFTLLQVNMYEKTLE